MELLEELSDSMEWVFRDFRISLKQIKYPLPHRYNMMELYVLTNTKELEKNLKLQGWPSDLQEKVKELVSEYWYVFCEDEFFCPIRVFSFLIETAIHSPICCKPPMYGPHKSEAMQSLVEILDENGMVEEGDGIWVELVVLAAKLHQENVPWHDYQWRPCVSYQKLNQGTRQLTFHIPRFDDSVKYINTEKKYFIAVDIDSGYL